MREEGRRVWDFAVKAHEYAKEVYPTNRDFRALFEYGAHWAYRELSKKETVSETSREDKKRRILGALTTTYLSADELIDAIIKAVEGDDALQ